MSQSGSYSVGGGGGGDILNLTGNTGGAIAPDGAGNINILGAGPITVAGNAGTHTLTISTTGGGLTWAIVVINTAMQRNDGYIANAVGTVQLLLPTVSVLGDIVRVAGITAGGWQITQSAGQQIQFGNLLTTVGVGGSLNSTASGDTVELVCVVANTSWMVLSGVGNINVV
jgi:hypothetical protein